MIQESLASKMFKWGFNLILLVLALITVIPFIWMLVSSFAPNSEIVKIGGSFFPKMSTLQNYINVQENFNFMRMFANSLFIAIVVTVIIIYTSAAIGFVFAKFHFRFKKVIFGIVLSTMMLPWCVTIIPKYEMMLQFGWLDSYKSLIIPSMISAFGIFLFRQSISQISDEMMEALGSTEHRIFIFSIASFYRCRATRSQVWRFSNSFGSGKISSGLIS